MPVQRFNLPVAPLNDTTFFRNRLRQSLGGFQSGVSPLETPEFRERKSNTSFTFSSFLDFAGIPRQNPGISRQKSLISMVSRDIPNFLAPTPSRGRPLPKREISGLESLGLCSFFVAENFARSLGKTRMPQQKISRMQRLGLQTPRPATEPRKLGRNPETSKVHFKVRKMPFWTPRKNGPKSQLKCPKSPFFCLFIVPKRGFLDILVDFRPILSRGPKWHISDFKMHFWGFGGLGLCSRSGRLQV